MTDTLAVLPALVGSEGYGCRETRGIQADRTVLYDIFDLVLGRDVAAVRPMHDCIARGLPRWASVHGSQSSTPATLSSVTSYVQSEAVGRDPSLLSVNANCSPNNNPGSNVTITVGYSFNPLTGLAIKQSINMASTAQFVINH